MLDWLRRHWHHNPSNVYIFLFTLICLYLCFPHYWPLWGKFTDCRWIPSQGFSSVEMWCFPVASIIKLVMKQLDDWWFETCGTYVMSLITMRMKASVAHIYACSVSNNYRKCKHVYSHVSGKWLVLPHRQQHSVLRYVINSLALGIHAYFSNV